jgi:hypothetical protein
MAMDGLAGRDRNSRSETAADQERSVPAAAPMAKTTPTAVPSRAAFRRRLKVFIRFAGVWQTPPNPGTPE